MDLILKKIAVYEINMQGGSFPKINKHAGSNKAVQGGFFSNINKRAVHVY